MALPPKFYLQPSPESVMKRMLAAGAPSIYSIGPVFRAGESGAHHNVEFTMLEWYEVDGTFDSAIRMTADLVCDVLGHDGFDRISYRDAFSREVGLDPLNCVIDRLRDLVAETDPSLASTLGDDRDEILDVILSERIAPKLGVKRPLVLTDYPLSQAALAKPSVDDEQCAARFELFSGGIELANGYDELVAPEPMKERAEINNRKRIRDGRDALPVQTSLYHAMHQGLPPSSGVALGFDRLLMLAVNESDLRSVLPFPLSIA